MTSAGGPAGTTRRPLQGVHSAMAGGRGLQALPNAIVVPAVRAVTTIHVAAISG